MKYLAKPTGYLPQIVASGLIILILSACSMRGRSDVSLTGLRTESRVDPTGLDNNNPYFSWKLNSPERNRYQEAYQLVVISNTGMKCFDTGMAISDNNIKIKYSGDPLQPDTRYSWKVRIKDNNGKVSRWSDEAFFSTGLMTEDDWEARWISSPDTLYSPVFGKEFELPEKPSGARIFVNAQCYYELYVNGEKVGKDILSPAVSDFRFENYYITYDITDYLDAGKNTIGLWTGRGWYSPGLPGVTHHSPVIRCQAHIDLEKEQIIIGSDASWYTAKSNISQIGAWRWNRMGGEMIDGRISMENWNLSARRNSVKAIAVHAPAAKTKAQACPVNIISDTIDVQEITGIGRDVWLVDFGKNFTGWMEMMIKNQSAGDTIRYFYSDFCNKVPVKKPDNTWDFGNAYIDQRNGYICSGTGIDIFIPKFNYQAFRYVVIEGLDQEPGKEDLKGYMIESNLEKSGSFTSSDKDLNAINELNTFTFRCLDAGGYYVDCPHRERLGYGDGQVAVETGIYNFNVENFYKKWTGNWHNAQKPDGEIPNTAPSPYGAGGGPGWGGTGVVLPWKIFKYYGDTAFLESSWKAMKGYAGFLETKMKNGLLAHYGDPVWGFIGDWVAPRRGMDSGNPVGEEEKGLFNNCYLLYLYDILSRSAKAIGETSDSNHFIEKGEKLRRAINERYFDPVKGIYANGEQSYLTFPLFMDVPDKDNRELVLSNLVSEIEVADEGHLNTGMLGTYFMLQYLTDIGRSDLVYMMMKQKTYPGWGYMIEQGANTCWEQWNGYWSNIHSCFTSGGGWFYYGVAGIGQKENSSAFKHLLLRPGLTGRIEKQDTWFESPYGRVVLSWEKKEDEELILHVEVPANSYADLVLPAGPDDSINESGRPLDENTYVQILSQNADNTVLLLKSGTYKFGVIKGSGLN